MTVIQRVWLLKMQSNHTFRKSFLTSFWRTNSSNFAIYTIVYSISLNLSISTEKRNRNCSPNLNSNLGQNRIILRLVHRWQEKENPSNVLVTKTQRKQNCKIREMRKAKKMLKSNSPIWRWHRSRRITYQYKFQI